MHLGAVVPSVRALWPTQVGVRPVWDCCCFSPCSIFSVNKRWEVLSLGGLLVTKRLWLSPNVVDSLCWHDPLDSKDCDATLVKINWIIWYSFIVLTLSEWHNWTFGAISWLTIESSLGKMWAKSGTEISAQIRDDTSNCLHRTCLQAH